MPIQALTKMITSSIRGNGPSPVDIVRFIALFIHKENLADRHFGANVDSFSQ